MINHSLMAKYNKALEKRNIVIVDCGLEKYHKTRGTMWDKVAFKIRRISYIGKGVPPVNKHGTLGASPSKK